MATLFNHTAPPLYFKKNFIHILFLTIVSAIVFSISVYPNGSGLTNDSINYLHAAASFIESNTLLKVDNTAFTEWPPLYPVLLSIAEYTTLSLITFTIVLHAVLYATNILLALYLLTFFIRKVVLLYIAGISLAFSTPLLLVHVFVWSEPFFITLLLLSIIFLLRYLQTYHLKELILLIIISILLYLQRKSGLLFILSHAGILFLLSSEGWKQKLKICLVYLTPTLGTVFIWNLIRFTIAGKVFEEAYWEPLRLGETVYQTSDILTSWIFPDELPFYIRIVITLLVIGISIYFLFIKQHTTPSLLLKILLLTFFNYVLLLNILLTYVHINDPVDDRILSPVYIPAFILIFALIQQLADQLTQGYSHSLIYILTIIWLIYPVARTSYHIKHWNEVGPGGYNLKAILDSSFGKHILSINNTDIIYTNNLYQTYYLKLIAKNKAEVKDISTYIISEKQKSVFVCFGNTGCSSIFDKSKIFIYKDNQGEIFKLGK